MGVVNVILQAT